MVKKLLKHELLSYLRILIPVECVVLALAVFTRILQFFESDSVIFDLIMGFGTFLFILSLFAGSVACFWVAITRFYKNLFTGEGYLSFTLPVTPAQHLFVKLGAALVMDVAVFVLALLSVVIATSGDLLTELLKAADYLLDQLFTVVSATHMILYVVEVLLLLLIARLYQYMLIYTCICIGQTFRKNRVLGAFGVYFGYTVVTQIFGTILSVIITILESTGVLENMSVFIEQHIYGFLHTVFIGSGVLNLLLSAVLFFICHFIMRKKLNLE